ncbi:Naphthoate synthase [Mameliella alba]|uniref:Naphthoate synthase n=1 Tax=Mameliella alba TaxID=561184 RepID=A0A0B3S522_9RHOB|nr:Naphthoate synthase [Mameliella alba]
MTGKRDFETILYEEADPVAVNTLNRPDNANMFTPTPCRQLRDCIEDIRNETRTQVVVLTGAGDKFFCIGGEKGDLEGTNLYPGVVPTLEMFEAIERLQ